MSGGLSLLKLPFFWIDQVLYSYLKDTKVGVAPTTNPFIQKRSPRVDASNYVIISIFLSKKGNYSE
jgi:hypothetical protein